ncbi:MAG: hypothetical protein Ta2B_13900 [Termitinemataceae bacterium]|nr:MAG: hypothetical protein Ta2B_13900 [Termitinemataceae bacterium]
MTEIKVSGLMGRIKDALGENWFEILQEKIELKRSTIYSWRENDTLPKTRDLYKISQATGESMEFLLTGKNRKDEYSSDEHNLDKKYYDKIQGKDIVNRIDNLLDKKGQTRKALVGAKCVKFLQTITDWKKETPS